ncbi:hypothetical protein Tco_0905173, partial [Tanacetum coccineum]
GVVDWKSTKQSIFATSSTDAEYIDAFDASKEAVWIHKFISGLGVFPTIEEPINMYYDNTGAIEIAKDHGVTKGARHFRKKVHYLRETIEMGDVRIEKVDTDDNLANPFTKALAFPKLIRCQLSVYLYPATPLPKWELLENGASDSEQLKSKANFRSMVADKVFDGVNISIPRKVIEKVNERSSFAWCLIEVYSEADLVDVVTNGIHSLTGDGFTKETIRVEYE